MPINVRKTRKDPLHPTLETFQVTFSIKKQKQVAPYMYLHTYLNISDSHFQGKFNVLIILKKRFSTTHKALHYQSQALLNNMASKM